MGRNTTDEISISNKLIPRLQSQSFQFPSTFSHLKKMHKNCHSPLAPPGQLQRKDTFCIFATVKYWPAAYIQSMGRNITLHMLYLNSFQ